MSNFKLFQKLYTAWKVKMEMKEAKTKKRRRKQVKRTLTMMKLMTQAKTQVPTEENWFR